MLPTSNWNCTTPESYPMSFHRVKLPKYHNLENLSPNFKPIFRGIGVIFFSLKRRVVNDLWHLMFVMTHPPWICSPLLDLSQRVTMQPAFGLVVGCWQHPSVHHLSTCVLADKVEASKPKNYKDTVTYRTDLVNTCLFFFIYSEIYLYIYFWIDLWFIYLYSLFAYIYIYIIEFALVFIQKYNYLEIFVGIQIYPRWFDIHTYMFLCNHTCMQH